MHRLSLRARLVLGVIALAAVGLIAADVATYTSLRSFLVAQVDRTLNSVERDAFGGPGPEGSDRFANVPGDCVQLRNLDESVAVGTQCSPAHPGGATAPPPKLPASVTLPPQSNTRDGDRVDFLTVSAVSGSGNHTRTGPVGLTISARVTTSNARQRMPSDPLCARARRDPSAPTASAAVAPTPVLKNERRSIDGASTGMAFP